MGARFRPKAAAADSDFGPRAVGGASFHAVNLSLNSGDAQAVAIFRATGPEGLRPEADASGLAADHWDWERIHTLVWPTLVDLGTKGFGLSREDAEDAIQAVYMRLITKRRRARNPEAYLRQAFLHHCCDVLEKRSRRQKRELPLENTDPADESAHERLEAASILESAYRRVPSRCREVLNSFFMEERTLLETATLTGYSPKTIWKRITACVRKVRACLSA